MKSIIKIEEYLPETNQIIVRFARLHAPQSIDNYTSVAVNCDRLDCYNTETFLHTLMRDVGKNLVLQEEEEEPIFNKVDDVSDELDLPSMVGKIIECKVDNDRKELLKMRRVEL